MAFVDEIFKANSAILNTLLTLLNERLFDNGSTRVHVPLLCLVRATRAAAVLSRVVSLPKVVPRLQQHALLFLQPPPFHCCTNHHFVPCPSCAGGRLQRAARKRGAGCAVRPLPAAPPRAAGQPGRPAGDAGQRRRAQAGAEERKIVHVATCGSVRRGCWGCWARAAGSIGCQRMSLAAKRGLRRCLCSLKWHLRCMPPQLQAIALRSPGTQGLQSVDDPAAQPLLTADDFDHTRLGCVCRHCCVALVPLPSAAYCCHCLWRAFFLASSSLAAPAHSVFPAHPQPGAASVRWRQWRCPPRCCSSLPTCARTCRRGTAHSTQPGTCSHALLHQRAQHDVGGAA